MDIKQKLEKYDLKEVFNHDEYLEYLDSKVVRTPKTGTILDYISKEQEKELRKQNRIDLEPFDPTPQYIREHINFAFKVYHEISQQNPKDELIECLNQNEAKAVLVSTNWYEKYNYKYKEA